MKLGTKELIIGIAILSSIGVTAYSADGPIDLTRGEVKSTVTVNKEGDVSLQGIVVTQKAGTNIFAQSRWGSAVVRWVITISSTTALSRRFGAPSDIPEIAIGDYLNVDGVIQGLGGDSLVIKAKKIRNWTKEDESAEFSGVVANSNPENSTLTIILKDSPNIVAKLPTGLGIKKGARTIYMSEVKNGDKLLKARGVYNPIDRILSVESMEIFQEKSIFDSRNFQGSLKSIAATTLPTTLTVTVENKDYTVLLDEKTELMNKARGKALLQRFVAGDSIRIYGAIEQTNLSNIKAEIVRNISL